MHNFIPVYKDVEKDEKVVANIKRPRHCQRKNHKIKEYETVPKQPKDKQVYIEKKEQLHVNVGLWVLPTILKIQYWEDLAERTSSTIRHDISCKTECLHQLKPSELLFAKESAPASEVFGLSNPKEFLEKENIWFCKKHAHHGSEKFSSFKSH